MHKREIVESKKRYISLYIRVCMRAENRSFPSKHSQHVFALEISHDQRGVPR